MKKRPHRQLCSINLRRVPRRLRADFKAWCAGRGVSMESALHALMRRAINNELTLNIKPRNPRKYDAEDYIHGEADDAPAEADGDGV